MPLVLPLAVQALERELELTAWCRINERLRLQEAMRNKARAIGSLNKGGSAAGGKNG